MEVIIPDIGVACAEDVLFWRGRDEVLWVSLAEPLPPGPLTPEVEALLEGAFPGLVELVKGGLLP